MKRLLKNKKALSPVVAAIILIAVTVAVSIAVAAWMGSLTIGFMETKEAKITAMSFDNIIITGTETSGVLNVTISNTGTAKVNIATIRINGANVDALDVYTATITAQTLPIQLEPASGPVTYVIDLGSWTAGNKYAVSLYETDGTLVGSFTGTA
ncbi:MAG: hypothetical protein IAX21_09365 [Candidatus Bathyarchaeota archaeon]|nr:MAG: hypothetical protein NUK63_08355 [Candidatus Bathyarchaeum tardum]WNZ28841.1 MAG: hypothetical protein IAX21_09365 [Candidatus Bathyarchaeota archaeon]